MLSIRVGWVVKFSYGMFKISSKEIVDLLDYFIFYHYDYFLAIFGRSVDFIPTKGTTLCQPYIITRLLNLPLPLCYYEYHKVKFIYSEKATQVCEISTLDFTGTTNFVLFSE